MTLKKSVEIECKCGAKITTNKEKDWCVKCGGPVFYDQKKTRQYQMNYFYILSAIIVAIGYLSYFFLELIVFPMFRQ
jgi:predicted nucleic acid-binding Zn ribbon protein